MDRTADVIVVGAGLAGLVATAALRDEGVDVVCLEARERVGGRMWSEAGWLDLGATWFWDGQPAIAATVASAGRSTYPQVLDGDALFEQATGEAVRVAGNPIDRPAWRLGNGMEGVALELAPRLGGGAPRNRAALHGLAVRR